MPIERRRKRESRDPDRRYGDRRLAKGFRTLVDDLEARGEIKVVDSPWGREFRPVEESPKDRLQDDVGACS